MKPDKLTIHDLFQKERRYVVPLYQRAYVWTRQEQWEPLWEDIERQAEACLESDNLVSKRSHFLGAIVLNVSKIVGSGVARSEVIDGQQRLTTLQIMIAALRDFAAATGSTHHKRFVRLTMNEDEKVGSDAAFKVWPTNADRATFRTVLSVGSPAALKLELGVESEATAPRLATDEPPHEPRFEIGQDPVTVCGRKALCRQRQQMEKQRKDRAVIQRLESTGKEGRSVGSPARTALDLAWIRLSRRYEAATHWLYPARPARPLWAGRACDR